MGDIRIALDLPEVEVVKVEGRERGGWTITVESTLKTTKCRQCGREISAFHGHDGWVEVRHLPILDQAVFSRYQPKRYRCPYCAGGPTTTQVLSWHVPPSPFTRAYEEHLLKALIHETRPKRGLRQHTAENDVTRNGNLTLRLASIHSDHSMLIDKAEPEKPPGKD
jgi:transposase